MYLEFRSTVMLFRRYILKVTIMTLITTFAMVSFINYNSDPFQAKIEVEFLKGIVVIAHVVFTTGMIFGYLDKFKVYFMQNRFSYFFIKLLMLFIYNSLISYLLTGDKILFWILVTILLTQISKHLSGASFIIYVYLRAVESSFLYKMSHIVFIEDAMYVIFVMVLLTVISLFIYILKEVDLC